MFLYPIIITRVKIFSSVIILLAVSLHQLDISHYFPEVKGDSPLVNGRKWDFLVEDNWRNKIQSSP